MAQTRALLIGCLVLLSFVHCTVDVNARVTRIEILQREPFADAVAFGEVGPYEFIFGRLHYAVAPDSPRNEAIVDLRAGSGWPDCARTNPCLSTVDWSRFSETIQETNRVRSRFLENSFYSSR